ncbi:hypothetical protein [Paraliomyxa miuraensis]|uniref:hypothetical protein n=1 Tax=Paraliomyxa miuraensis TaxID=376150 RepID=UPI0022504D52|nr:hypothetical protein [Paraliomyxa miuraensis]MCX4244921.1 hypothetical protein [Paraliomyxa miuraensis]
MRTKWLVPCSIAFLVLACGDDGSTNETGAAATETGPGDGTVGDGPTEGDTTSGIAPGTMSFFVTSQGSGARGGNFGGLAGADAWCQELAVAAGVGDLTWHAYLSTTTEDARDRIGAGPWYNYAGEMIAADVASLHANGLSNDDPQHVLTEYGEEVEVADSYDILTGSTEEGTYYEERTCNDWTSDTSDVKARVGHSSPPNDPEYSSSWNSAHATNGCSEDDLIEDTGIGRVYCFAID